MAFFTTKNLSSVTSPLQTESSTFNPATNFYLQYIQTLDVSKPKNGSGPEDYIDYSKSNAAKIFIRHIKSGYKIIFPSILESFTDTPKPNFSTEQIYGFTDGIQKFTNTSRTIGIGFKLLAYDEQHARKNLYAACALAQFMYGQYDGAALGTICNPLVLREPPMFRIRFANMLQRTGRGKISNENTEDYMAEDGLLVVPTSYNFTPNIEAGFFFGSNGTSEFLYPKEIKLSLNCNVLHEETTGWTDKDTRLEWVGKTNSNGNYNSNNVVFPWGKDSQEFIKSKNALPTQNANEVILPSTQPPFDESQKALISVGVNLSNNSSE